MTSSLFLVGTEDLADGTTTVRLDGAEGRHAADVQRIGVGEQILVSDGAGRLASCTVTAAHRGALDLAVDELRHEPPPARHLVLVQALAKGDRDLLAVEVATELDVDEIVPWQADRSVVRWRGERGERSRRRWQQAAVTATKQARRARVPEVGDLVGRAGLLERVREATLALVLHEEATEPLREVTLPEAGEVLLVVGPEGGVAPAELEALTASGGRPVRLGSTVLRTSTAGAAALASLHTLGGWRWA